MIANKLRGWKARFLAWKKSFPEALADYRSVAHPRCATGGRPVHAYLTKGGNWKRYYLPLLACFHRSGHPVSVRPGVGFFASDPDEDFGFFRCSWIRLTVLPPARAILLTDCPDTAHNWKERGRIVCLLAQDDYRAMIADHEIRLPFLMHPKIYTESGGGGFPEPEEGGDRSVRLCFAGNLNPRQYDSPSLGDFFGIGSRHRIATRLLETRAGDCLWVRTWDDKKLLDRIDKPIVIVDSFKAGLNAAEYHSLLSSSQFYLAMPGVNVPFCHNFAEAISHCCIPVTQFASWMTPLPLEHGRNCISFRRVEDLDEAIAFVLSADRATVALLQQEVAALWREHLHPEAVTRGILRHFDLSTFRPLTALIKTGNIPPSACRRIP